MQRKLNPLEHAVWLGGQTLPLNEVIVWRVHGRFSLDQLQNALRSLRTQQPFSSLRVSVDSVLGPSLTNDGVPEFEVREEDIGPSADWTPAAEEELERPFSWDEGPLLRFRLLRSEAFTDILLSLHHALYDGLSSHYIMHEIMTLMAEGPKKQAAAAFPPTFDDLLPPEASRRLGTVLSLNAVKLIGPFCRVWLRLRRRMNPSPSLPIPAVLNERSTQTFRVIHGSIPPENASNLLSGCKARKVSVLAAASAACLLALAKRSRDKNLRKYGFASPVNMRPWLSPPLTGELGLFLSRINAHIYCAPNQDFWQTARKINEKIQRRLVKSKLFTLHLLVSAVLAGLPDDCLGPTLARFGTRPARYDFTISNVGRLPVRDNYGPYRVSASWGMENLFAGRRTVAIQSLGNALFFTLSFRDFVMGKQEASGLLSDIIQQLEFC